MIVTTIRPLKIFLVENHPDTLKALTSYLERCGHTVVSAQTMKKALASFPEAGCEVLLSDIGLPDGDGWQLLRGLRDSKNNPNYAIAMSGYGTSIDRAKSNAAGYSQHLVKPFKIAELDDMLKEAVHALDGSKGAT